MSQKPVVVVFYQTNSSGERHGGLVQLDEGLAGFLPEFKQFVRELLQGPEMVVLTAVSEEQDPLAEKDPLADILIEELDLPVRAHNRVKRLGIMTLADLLDYTEDGLLTRGRADPKQATGPITVSEIGLCLASHGYALRQGGQFGGRPLHKVRLEELKNLDGRLLALLEQMHFKNVGHLVSRTESRLRENGLGEEEITELIAVLNFNGLHLRKEPK
jgi:DNA-directed RNA polymerase alpha subunit